MEDNRRFVGFALFGSAGLFVLVAVLIFAGTLGVPEESRQTVGLLVAGMAALDAALAVYFVLSS